MKSILFRALFFCATVSAATAGAQTIGHAAPPVSSSESGTAVGSARTSTTSDSSRSYDAQALRVESRWGSINIIRGVNGPVVGSVGWFRRFDVEKLVESSPQATTEAGKFKSNNFRGSLIAGLGATTLVAGAILTSNSSSNASSPMLMIAGAGAMVWGVQYLNKGYSALSRAMWWYNRDLPRATTAPSNAGIPSTPRDRAAPAGSKPPVTK
ncbi:MAG TPA: hypothetical protein VK544_00360 [Gemmatimonadaceae bacterium]|nr:hypothetical protein [Gemmatimonadaceae bacterium]